MKKIFLFILLGNLFFTGKAQTTTEKLESYLNAAEKAGQLNGAVLVVQKGVPLIDKGFGLQNFETNTPNTRETIFQIGSVTKQFTAAVILKLVEEEKLQLSDKLSKYYKDFPNGDKITIEHLLTHTSGLYNYTRNTALMTAPDRHASEEFILSLFRDQPLDFEPGSKFSYSNSGYQMLGYIIEKVTKKPYYQVVREWIFNPLGMTQSGFNFTGLNSTAKAMGYASINNNIPVTTKIVDSSVSFSAGAIYTTTGDLYKWDKALMQQKLLKKDSWKNLFTARQSKYGLGVFIDSVEGRQRISHGGGIHGFASYNAMLPKEEIAIIMISNNISTNLSKLTDDVLAILHNKPYKLAEPPAVIQEIKLDEAVLRQYVGDYELAPAFHIIVKLENGKFTGQATGQEPFELFAEKENLFFLKVVEAKVEFLKNADGKVDKMILYQNGAKLAGTKKME